LNVIQNITKIEQLVAYIYNQKGCDENQIYEEVYSTTSKSLKEKINFLHIIGAIEKRKDKIVLESNFNKSLNSIFGSKIRVPKNKKEKELVFTKIKVELLELLAAQSFDIDIEKNYTFKNQAATLLIYSYMTNNSHNYLTLKQQSIDRITVFFNELGYRPVNKNGNEIKLNTHKLENALLILSHFGLVERIKAKTSYYYYPKFDPYLFYFILKKSLKNTRTEQSISDLLTFIGTKYIPLVKGYRPVMDFSISPTIGGALWILFTRKHIKLSNKGDVSILSNIPSFIEAKFSAKVNWIELISK